tara:strand:- start:1003 stop:1212 length:210 start_codon:yes stop_codon:yes gene_type:complete
MPAPLHFFLMLSFPDGKVPAETFVDPDTFDNLRSAVSAATDFVREENADFVVVYLRDGEHNVRVLKISK